MNKKLLIILGAVGACLITIFVLFGDFNDKEKTLAGSMEETKKEHQKTEELLTRVNQEFKNKGYGEIPVHFTSIKRILTVQVKDEKFADRHGDEIKTLINDVAREINFKGVQVKFKTINIHKVNEEDKILMELTDEVSKVTSELLSQKGYSFSMLSINPSAPNPNIEIRIQGTKEFYTNVKPEIERIVADAVSSKTNINFDVKLIRKSENDIRDEKWQPIFRAIYEETDKKFEEYRGFAHSFHPEPLQIIIKTDLENSIWWWNSDEKVKEIEKYVEEIVKLKREELSIKEIPFEVIVRDKKNKKLN